MEKKLMPLLLIITVVVAFLPQPVQAAVSEVRVGLTALQNVTQVAISAAQLTATVNGQVVCTVASSGNFTVTPANAPFARSGTYQSMSEASAAAQGITASSGRAAYPAYTDSGWCVYAEGGSASAGLPILLRNSAGESVLFDAAVVFHTPEGQITVGGKSYRGGIAFVRAAGSLTAVNVVDIEQYLYSVVPSEIVALWHIEAVKAQAVAARSYALTQVKHSGAGYDLCDTVHCQVYGGVADEHANATQAVNDTAGLVAYYNNQPINAVFSSSSGGHTENSEDVWLGAEPYLRSVEDLYETQGLVWTRTFTLSQINACLAANGANIGSAQSVTAVYSSGNNVAEIIINGSNGSKSILGDSIRTFFEPAGGSLKSKTFLINGQGGAIPVAGGTELAHTDAAFTHMVNGSGRISAVDSPEVYIRNDSTGTQINLSEAAIAGAQLSSVATAANTNWERNSITSSGNSIVLEGRGWGHGVGLSQYGAKGMAEAGFNFIAILKYYYTGIEVR